MSGSDDIVIEVRYGFAKIDFGLFRYRPDGSMQLGCRVRNYDNKPCEPEHLVSDEMHWNTTLTLK